MMQNNFFFILFGNICFTITLFYSFLGLAQTVTSQTNNTNPCELKISDEEYNQKIYNEILNRYGTKKSPESSISQNSKKPGIFEIFDNLCTVKIAPELWSDSKINYVCYEQMYYQATTTHVVFKGYKKGNIANVCIANTPVKFNKLGHFWIKIKRPEGVLSPKIRVIDKTGVINETLLSILNYIPPELLRNTGGSEYEDLEDEVEELRDRIDELESNM